MLEIYIDSSTGRRHFLDSDIVISFINQGMTEEQAVIQAINELNKRKWGGCTRNEAMQRLLQNGYDAYEAEKYIEDSLYSRTIKNFSIAYPFEEIIFRIDMHTKDAMLSICARDIYTAAYLKMELTPPGKKMHPYKSMYHDKKTNYNEISSYERLSLDGVNINFSLLEGDILSDIEAVINTVFDKLGNLTIAEEKIHFKKAFQQARFDILQAAENYYLASKHNFSNGNYYLRTNKLEAEKYSPNFPKEHLPNEKEEALKDSIVAGDENLTLQLLQEGIDVDTIYYRVPVLDYAFPLHDSAEKRPKTTIIQNIKNLVSYGVNPHINFGFGPALATLVYNVSQHNERDCPQLYAITKEIIRIMIFIDGGESFCYVPAELASQKNSLPAWVFCGLWAVQTQNFMPRSIAAVARNPLENFTFYKMVDNKTVTVKTMSLKQALADVEVVKRLFVIFKENFPWKGKISEEELPNYLFEVCAEIQGAAGIDLVKIDNKIKGFNIFQWVQVMKDSKPALIHQIKLAVAEPEVIKYRGLMRIVSYSKGFVVAQQSNMEVLTVCEVASLSSYLQLVGFHFCPHISNCIADWYPILKKTIYADITTEPDAKGYWYQPDPLATFKNKNGNKNSFWTRTALMAESFVNSVAQEGFNIVTGFVNNDVRNIKAFQAILENNLQNYNSDFFNLDTTVQAKL